MEKFEKVKAMAHDMQPSLVAVRRFLHAHPELGWSEYSTTALIVVKLKSLGYEVLMGADVTAKPRMGMPAPSVLAKAEKNAKLFGVSEEMIDKMHGGRTGAVGILRCGEGPTVALRFDIDALPLTESTDDSHRPAREGWISQTEGVMHACAHDGHTAIGLGVAEVLANMKDELHGTVKIIFQPAEEGVRGAAAMVKKGIVDDCDYLLSGHIQTNEGLDGDIITGAYGAYATTKLDAVFHGRAAHAASAPQSGHNVIQGIAAAVTNLYAIPRDAEGDSRVNVGTIHAGSGRNVIADYGKIELEVRGATTGVNDYMEEHAIKILESCAMMYDLTVEIEKKGQAPSMSSDESLVERLDRALTQQGINTSTTEMLALHDSEDIAAMMQCVQKHGGQATFMRLLTHTTDNAHGIHFDFDEQILEKGVQAYSLAVLELMKGE